MNLGGPEVTEFGKSLFDILKKDVKGTFHWMDRTHDLASAEATLRRLCVGSKEEFVIFRQADLQVVATYSDQQYKRL